MNKILNLSSNQQLIVLGIAFLLLLILIIIIIILINKVKKPSETSPFLAEEKKDNRFIDELPIYQPEEKKPATFVEEKKPLKFDINTAAQMIEETLENDNNLDLTKYELEQEERSIISYQELKRIASEQKNNNVKVVNLSTPNKDESSNTEVLDFSDITTEYKFKPSEFISPVSGIEKNDFKNDLIDIENLNKGIKSSNEFLEALKELKNNLD